MIRYAVRSRQVVDIIAEIRRRTLILSPFFQRNLVWRLVHKVDFIETILLGFPFPQIFISKGTIDVDTMRSTSCVVDGQQRLSAINEFLVDGFVVRGRAFSEFTADEKEEFLKYEIPVIDLDMRDNDPRVKEIFKRLNRTFYSLSNIEKLSTEYGSSEFMLVAKYLCGEIVLEDGKLGERHYNDPNITAEFVTWASRQKISHFREFVLNGKIFSPYETSRMVHLQYTLNLMATFERGLYNRNDGIKPALEDNSDEYYDKDVVVRNFERAAEIYAKLRFPKGSMFLNKANAFSLFFLLSRTFDHTSRLAVGDLKLALVEFSNDPPADYVLAAREGVNNKREREIRDAHLNGLMGLS